MKRLGSFRHAFEGIIYAFQTQWNFRFHVFALIVVVALGFLLEISVIEWLIVLLCISIVLATELINTAIESSIDLVTKEHHQLAKAAKDTSAGAVLISTIFSAIIGMVVFLPKLL